MVPSPNLRFIPKGSIVRVDQDGKPLDIEMDFVENCISSPGCLILVTVTCESEFHSTLLASLQLTPHAAKFESKGAHQMAKQYDPNGQRTIGSYIRVSRDYPKLISPRRSYQT